MAAGAQRCARAVIEYDGTAFAGSQVQANARTVQGELEEALNRLIGERTRVRLAGRTDAGVHATGQVVAFCLPRRESGWTGWRDLKRRLNGALPRDVAVRSLTAAPRSFDPRRDARWRVYRYRILMDGVRRPLERYRTLEIDEPLDVGAMRAAASSMLGERDFSALGADARGLTVRRIAEIRITRRGPLIEVRVTANAFLRRMVRSMVALLMEAGRGKLAPGDVEGVLDRGERALAGRAAPPRGLTLERVVYESARQQKTGTASGPSGAGAGSTDTGRGQQRP